MKVHDIHRFFQQWAPAEVAWEKDNIGLQVGDDNGVVKGILVSLDVTGPVLAEALRRRTNVIISHHPLLFRPLRSITPREQAGRYVQELIRNRVHAYSAHTNLDFTRGGTSFALAGRLGLVGVDFLVKRNKLNFKVVTFVPAAQAQRVADVMAQAGAGTIGNYEQCSFRMEGTGTYRPNDGANPVVGTRGRLEKVPEVRLEMIVPRWNLAGVLSAMKQAHPYEEAAYDVYHLENHGDDSGMGVIGELKRPQPLSSFLRKIKRSLGTTALRWTGNPDRIIHRVAACGGSGADLLDEAVNQRADVFVTADVKYHGFHDADGRIALVDAGHYETELPVVHTIVERLKSHVRDRRERIPVYATTVSTNPIAGM